MECSRGGIADERKGQCLATQLDAIATHMAFRSTKALSLGTYSNRIAADGKWTGVDLLGLGVSDQKIRHALRVRELVGRSAWVLSMSWRNDGYI
jgi:hypothetical protein